MDFEGIPQGDMPQLPEQHDHPKVIEHKEPIPCCIPFNIFHAFTHNGSWNHVQNQITVALGKIHNPDQGIHLDYIPSDKPTMCVNVGIDLTNKICLSDELPLSQFSDSRTPPDSNGIYWGVVLLSHYTHQDSNIFCARRTNKYASGQMGVFWSKLTCLLKLQPPPNYKPCNIICSKQPNQLSTIKYL